MTTPGLDLTVCPDTDGCGLPAEVVDRFVLVSTSGPVVHVATECVARHRYVTTDPEEGP